MVPPDELLLLLLPLPALPPLMLPALPLELLPVVLLLLLLLLLTLLAECSVERFTHGSSAGNIGAMPGTCFKFK